jgi:enoyl-CoA hydratase/carnithine racemase
MAVDYQKESKIFIITLNRPEALNAQNAQFHRELGQALIEFRDDPDLWVAIVHGAGNAFSAGADIKEFRPVSEENAQVAEPRIRAEQIWKPFIAAIHGYCLGGGLQLAMEFDLRIAADNARFGYPEARIGFMPGSHCTLRLPRLIARTHVMELMFLGKQIDAHDAYRMGLINRVVEPDQLMPAARKWAETICEAGPLGIRAIKEAIIKGYNMTWEEGLKLEAELIRRVRSSEDYLEGARAFAEKRKPIYKAK